MTEQPTDPSPFPTIAEKGPREDGTVFAPVFDASGLVTAIAVDAEDGTVLMVAHMNADALRLTLDTGIAHYWSRSRQELWLKGATSGNTQSVVEVLTDCDQDALVLKVRVAGDGASCHTGRRSCFYRKVALGDGSGQPLSMIQDG
ncbi:MAG: phosphoribosyl-AMP cyclohydrolase [Pseudomonadota bacterium]